jgi:hypothetical protein
MFHEDGTMRKSCKSDLVKQFENEVCPVLSLCLFSLTDRHFFQSRIFLPSMTWNTFVWAATLVRRSLVSDQEVFDCPDLYSTQEEADTRMILQALHADKRLKTLGKQGFD